MERMMLVHFLVIGLQILVVIGIMALAAWYFYFYKDPRDIEVERRVEEAEKKRKETEEKYERNEVK